MTPPYFDPHARRGGAVETAIRLRAERSFRASSFGAAIVSDPAWDMLLDLRIAAGRGMPLRAEKACLELAGWPSRARCIRMLQGQGLVSGSPRETLAPDSMLRLTPKGMERMDAHLAALG